MAAHDISDIDAAFKDFSDRRIGALLFAGSGFYSSRVEKLAKLPASYKIPTIHSLRDFAIAGGLMTYGSIPPDAYRTAGVLHRQDSQGRKPADLPVQQGTKVNS